MPQPDTAPCVFVIFGATGDLAKRKILPAVGALWARGAMHPASLVLAVTRDPKWTAEAFRDTACAAMAEAGLDGAAIAAARGRLEVCATADAGGAGMARLAEEIGRLEASRGLPGNRVFYLALPPEAFPGVVDGLGAAGLNRSAGYTRLVIEKPFGRDAASAAELDRRVHRSFDEGQIYRIDHYLGKETVQNLFAFRFANTIFESLWNRDRVHSIQISVAEEAGVGSRASYYERAGALRDMVQNHLLQLLALVAMEAPSRFDAESIRHEKIKVLRSVAPILGDEVVLGQYGPGAIGGRGVAGYAEEPGVAPGSRAETFAALRLHVDTFRWHGVPFYLRTGKRLPERVTEVIVRFRQVPLCLFEVDGACRVSSNLLVLRLQPDEGFCLHIDVKRPGSRLDVETIPLSFRYADEFAEVPEAYVTLLADVLQGDPTLFVHSDEVMASWRLVDPLLAAALPVDPYAAGTPGPERARGFAIPERDAVHARTGRCGLRGKRP